MTARRSTSRKPRDTASLSVKSQSLQQLREAVFKRHGKLYSHLREESSLALEAHAARLNAETRNTGQAARDEAAEEAP